MAPWDITKLSVHYIQKGLLFVKPSSMIVQENSVQTLLERLKESLSLTLVHFYPLAGRLETSKQENPPHYSVYINNSNSPGAKFIHAMVNLTLSDILSPVDVPLVVQSFFDHDRAINHDGHTLSLLSIQVTELVDGIFIGCSINHTVIAGTSYWHFFNTWSDIFMTNNPSISRPTLLNQYSSVLNLPFTHHDQFISRRRLGWAAWQLREAVANHNDKAVRWVEKWMKTPLITRTAEFFDPCGILVSSSPRFKMYENEFGMGRAVAIRSGYANKLDGKVMMYPGYEGGGIMDLEVCLLPKSMRDLESDGEVMDAVCI
ncbi:putative acetyltransferase [Camellia lanceoleosa]|uniref:Acetyltransferase n=1 Tax=Camellia lanceoleosa TaxID=1840588 RepID=A0ACC0I8F2_9ERIC|nr:putative acetyltransferase [Camellia lanceoleosa]